MQNRAGWDRHEHGVRGLHRGIRRQLGDNLVGIADVALAEAGEQGHGSSVHTSSPSMQAFESVLRVPWAEPVATRAFISVLLGLGTSLREWIERREQWPPTSDAVEQYPTDQ